MSIYFRISKADIGKGFITHDDQQKSGLSFSIKDDIVEVKGDKAAANIWASRVKATVIPEKDALIEIDQDEETALNNEIITLDARKSEIQSKLNVLVAKIQDVQAIK